MSLFYVNVLMCVIILKILIMCCCSCCVCAIYGSVLQNGREGQAAGRRDGARAAGHRGRRGQGAERGGGRLQRPAALLCHRARHGGIGQNYLCAKVIYLLFYPSFMFVCVRVCYTLHY